MRFAASCDLHKSINIFQEKESQTKRSPGFLGRFFFHFSEVRAFLLEVHLFVIRAAVSVVLIGNGGNMMYRAVDDHLRPLGAMNRQDRTAKPGWDFSVGLWMFAMGLSVLP